MILERDNNGGSIPLLTDNPNAIPCTTYDYLNIHMILISSLKIDHLAQIQINPEVLIKQKFSLFIFVGHTQ